MKCACGNTFTTFSTVPSITVDICSACHPLFTGKHKFVDTEGRIVKFQRKRALGEERKKTLTAGKKGKKSESNQKGPTVSLKELLTQARTTKE